MQRGVYVVSGVVPLTNTDNQGWEGFARQLVLGGPGNRVFPPSLFLESVNPPSGNLLLFSQLAKLISVSLEHPGDLVFDGIFHICSNGPGVRGSEVVTTPLP